MTDLTAILESSHLAELRQSCISDEIILSRGYKTVTDTKELQKLGFAHWQARPGLLVPIWDVRGKNTLFQLKPIEPRVVNKKSIKYETPHKSRPIIDVPRKCQPDLLNPNKPLYVTEGAKKVDSLATLGLCSIGLLGVWSWRGRNELNGKTVLPDFESIAWNERQVYIIFDNDVLHKKPVQAALHRFSAVIKRMGARVKIVFLPGNNGQKLGIDDWIAQGNGIAELMKLLEASKPITGNGRRQFMSEDYIEALSELDYTFSMNSMNDRLYVNNKPITDPVKATIRTQMRDHGFGRYLPDMEDAYHAYAYSNQFHPIRDWLDSLDYDGQNYISMLASHFEDTDTIFRVWLKRWLIGAIAKIYQPGKTQNMMLVLDGNQQIGKSYFARWLCSAVPDFFVESPLNPDNKDHVLRLRNNFIWEVGELGATMRRADHEALKFILTLQTVTERNHYGRFATTKPATCSFIGTINNEAGFLNDPTGSRRFYVCELTSIDWNYTDMDVNKVWGQAVHLYRNGEPWPLTQEETLRQSAINARYRIGSAVQDLFLQHFTYDTNDKETWIPAAEILVTLQAHGLRDKQRANYMKLSSVLKELGIKRGRRSGKNGYYGVKKRS